MATQPATSPTIAIAASLVGSVWVSSRSRSGARETRQNEQQRLRHGHEQDQHDDRS
jgi:hypothetical protein